MTFWITMPTKRISILGPRAGIVFTSPVALTVVSYFNPRSPCGERLADTTTYTYDPIISIHAPRAGSDRGIFERVRNDQQFQSTLPVRGATSITSAMPFSSLISIHAPRAGSDGNRLRQ